MAEYIEKEALINSFRSCRASKDLIDSIVYRINLQEAADVAPVRHGRWEYGDYYDIGDVCSECLWDSQLVQPSYRYCPNCGAKMDEVNE